MLTSNNNIMSILAIIIALLLNHTWKGLYQLRSAAWLPSMILGLNRLLGKKIPLRDVWMFALTLALPLGVIFTLDAMIPQRAGVLADLVFTVLVVTYCIGPRDLDQDVSTFIKNSDDNEIDHDAAKRLVKDPLSSAPDAAMKQLIQGIFRQSLLRWFGVIFWFALLGPVGALLFRLSQWLLASTVTIPERQRLWSAGLSRFLEWPAAQLMTLGLAIAADFDTVLTAWRHYHREQGHGLWEADNGFMLAAALEAVKGGHANRDGFADQLGGPLGPVKLAMDLVWRLLGVWLVALALILLAGWLA